MKALLLVSFVMAVTSYDSCNHPEMAQQLRESYQVTLKACQDAGGVPIIDYVIDTGGRDPAIPQVSNCILRPIVGPVER